MPYNSELSHWVKVMCWSAIELDKKPSSLLNISIINLPLKGNSLKDHREIPREKNSCGK